MKHARNLRHLKKQQLMCKKIKEIRLKQNRTQVDVAASGGLNSNYYGKIERGKTGDMCLLTLRKVRKGLGVKWTEILNPPHPLLAFLYGTEKEDDEQDEIS